MKKILKKAEELYNYLYIKEELKPVDFILGCGCLDKNIPKYASFLYKNGYGFKILFSGSCGKNTIGRLKLTEAKYFRDIAILENVVIDDILLEEQAKNTYENFLYTDKILRKNGYSLNNTIVIHKPYVLRRCRIILDYLYPNNNFIVSAYNQSFNEFINNNELTSEEIINEIVGEVNSIIIGKKLFELNIDIPSRIIHAYNFLKVCGYVNNIISEDSILDYLKD